MQRNTLPRILTGLLLWLASSLSFHNSIIQQNGPRKLSRRGLNADTKLSVLPNSGFFLGDSNVGIDLEALQRAIESPGTALDSSTSTLTSLALLATGVSVFLYDQRPVGSCREDLVDVRRSQYIKGGLGVMAKTFIPKGTIIGKYPGYKKSQDRFKYGKFNEECEDKARIYTWQLDEDTLIDPTDSSGNLPLELSWFGLLKVKTTLARVNEPPKGKDVNTYVKVENDEVVFIAERDILANEELFIDYGLNYDRSNYGKGQPKLQRELEQQRNLEDKQNVVNEDVTVRPIRRDRNGDIINDGVEEEDKKEERYRKRGIMSTDDAVKMFQERGAEGLFASAEDQDIMDTFLGKQQQSAPSNSETEDWEAQFEEWVRKNSAESAKANEETKISISKPRKSVFDTIDAIPLTGSGATNTILEDDGVEIDDTKVSPPSSVPAAMSKSPLKDMSRQDINKLLQEKISSMSDEEVQQMAGKLATALFTAVGDDTLKSVNKKSLAKDLGKPKSITAKVPPSNPDVRAKYAEEFKQLDTILNGMYQDPISTLQEILKNPDKYLEGIEEDINAPDMKNKPAADKHETIDGSGFARP